MIKTLLWALVFGLISSVTIARSDSVQKEDNSPFLCEELDLETPDLLGQVNEHQKINFCHDKAFSEVVSKNCKGDCELLKRAKRFDGKLEFSQRGTPGSWVCKKLHAESAIYFVKKDQTEYKVSFCHEKDDWVSAMTLLKNLKKSR